MRFAIVWCVVAAVIGCAPSTPESPPQPPEAQAYEDYRAGLFALEAAQESLAEALSASQKLQAGLAQGSEVEAGLTDIVYGIDSAGTTIADFAVDPPTEAEFNSEFARHDDARLKAIEAINDALHDLRESSGLARDMSSRISGMQGVLQDLAGLMDVAEQDLLSALGSLGGNDEGVPTS